MTRRETQWHEPADYGDWKITHSQAAIMSNASSQWRAYSPFRPFEEIYSMNSENADLRLK